ncbi:MATE family efflux transporter [Myxococcota bacterium]|nr:MATE family efflux transporter [Myxococcota bacterium]
MSTAVEPAARAPSPDPSAPPEHDALHDPATRRLLEGPLAWGVLRFGVPLVIGMALYTTFNLVDMFMISRLEDAAAALAALGICDMIAAIPAIISNGLSTGTVAIITRRAGEGDRRGVSAAAWQSLVLVGVCSVVFGLAGIFGSAFVVHDVMQAKGEVAVLATSYLEVAIGGAFSIFFLLQLTAILRALGRPKSAAALLVGGNLINVVLDVFLIYGQGPHPELFAWARPIAVALDVPRLGMMGAIWATVIGRTIPVLVGFVVLARCLRGTGFGLHVLRPNRPLLVQLVRVGWPSSAQLVVRIGAILVFLAVVASSFTTDADASVLTAYSVCLRVETLVLFLGMGWGAAASSYVGTNLGARQPARAQRAGWLAALYNAVLAAALAGLFITYAAPIIGFFEDAPAVLAAGETYLRWVAPSYVVVAIGVVLSQAMTGSGATMTSLVLDASVLALAVIPAALVVTKVFDAPPEGLWLTIALGNAVIAIVFAVTYAKGRFLERRV